MGRTEHSTATLDRLFAELCHGVTGSTELSEVQLYCLNFLADCLVKAHEAGDESWTLRVNLEKRWLCLYVAERDAVTLHPDHVMVTLQQEESDAIVNWRKYPNLDPHPENEQPANEMIRYVNVVPPEALSGTLDVIQDSLYRHIDQVAVKLDGTSKKPRLKGSHEAEVVEHLAKTLGRTLPQPGQRATSSGDSVALEEVVAAVEFSDGAVEFATREVETRLGQPEFRAELLRAYDTRCAITRSEVEVVLQAAHVRGVSDGGSHSVTNGLLLRSDIHNLFDSGLIWITPGLTVRVAPELENSEYWKLNGREIAIPESPADRPSSEALRRHASIHGR